MEILSIDGGGIKGLLVSKVLERLRLSHVDFVAGTSTGGLIALALASGYEPKAISEFYLSHGSKIFSKRRTLIPGVFSSKYGQENLRHALLQIFDANMKMGDLRKLVLVPAFDLEKDKTWKPKFYHNFPVADSDANELVIDVAMKTAAAPSYFPSYKGFIDGAVVANNPSMAALAQVMRDFCPGEVSMLSLGTGREERYVDGCTLNWGLYQWASPIIDILIGGSMSVADYQCRAILGDRYYRLDPLLPRNVEIGDADPETLEMLGEVALSEDLSELLRKLPRYRKQS